MNYESQSRNIARQHATLKTNKVTPLEVTLRKINCSGQSRLKVVNRDYLPPVVETTAGADDVRRSSTAAFRAGVELLSAPAEAAAA